MNVFQSRLFLALLDIQDFYESTLLDPNKNNEEKTAAALDVAIRWENISSPSLVASTIDLRRSISSNNLSSFDRARSLYQINTVGGLEGEPVNCFTPTMHKAYGSKLHREQQPQRNQSNSTLSFSMPNYSPSIDSPYNNNNGTDYSPQTQGVLNHPRSTVIYYSTESGVYDNVHAANTDKVTPADKWPIAKPRQRRLRKSKPVAPNVADHTRLPECGWDANVDSSKSSQSNHLITDTEPNVRSLADEEEEANPQWNLFSHLPITTEVIIHKTSDGFGFSIAGGRSMGPEGSEMSADIFVTRVNPSGAANQEGGLQVGDRIISVNGISLIGVSHEEAVRALQLAGNRLKLVVERRNPRSISAASSSVSLPPIPTGNKNTTIIPTLPGTTSAVALVSGSRASTMSSDHGATSMSSAGLTNTSLASGSLLFDPGTSKQTVNLTGVRSIGRVTSRPATSESGIAQSEPPIAGSWPQQDRPEDLTHTKRQSSLDMGYVNQLDCKLFSGVVKSATVDRKSRRNLIPASFPAFSWCTGIQKPIGCAAILGGGHRSLPGSSASSRRTPTGSTESRGKYQVTSGAPTISSRPVPAPQPGPLLVDVTLLRGTRSGLGFSIAGGIGNETVDGDPGIFITKLTPGGVAETDGRISVGDRIVQVNEASLVEVTHEQAVRSLRQAGDHVQLILVKQSVHPSRLIWSNDYDERISSRLEQASPTSSSPKIIGKTMTNKPDDKIRNPADQCSPSSSPMAASSQGEYERATADEPTRDINSSYFSPSGEELFEAQMSGLIDYTAAASVADIVAKWPKARLVTLHRSARFTASGQGPNEQRKHRRSRSVGGSLGLNIVGGDGSEATFVSQVQPDKPAGLCKRIFVGDRLLAVNGIDVSEHGHEQAAAALRGAPDRVDLVLVYCPEEYAEFEKYYSRQLKAVGHKMSSKTVKQLARTTNTTHAEETSSRPIGKRHHNHRYSRRKSSVPSTEPSVEPSTSPNAALTRGTDRAELFLRCQVDYDPIKESHQAVPKKAFALRSGDLICVVNWTDPEWWEAQRIDPMSSEVVGPIGLVPSRQRLERRERARSRHVNFLARAGRPVETGSLEHAHSGGHIDYNESVMTNTTHRRDHSLGMAVSVISLASSGGKHSDRRDTTRACRPNEVEGRDYHFVVSRETMVADIAAQRYLEAGEYNGNLYGTHLESVFEVAELGLHCLLDVGGPALRRLEAAGLPPIAILVLPETFCPQPVPAPAKSPDSGTQTTTLTSTKSADTKSMEMNASHNAQIKLARLIRHFSSYLTAILATDDFDAAYSRVKELIFENSGSLVWLNSPQPIP
ncbi:Discs large 1 protein [Fasciola hepatica]|uniref:Discs large 1 protein n=1 Tax=Fasciola hepatica TaxID=6192 RepID=A0A4E0RN62_FASHE|nr:Discs large 1 protein [Fasciola hepatica]